MSREPAADPRLARLVAQLGDRFEFIAQLGQGGAGTVYEVRNRRLDRLEALKVLSEALQGDAARRFAHEARIAASLDHPSIVKIFEFGEDAGFHWFSMQHVDGPTLSDLMEEGQDFPAETLVRLAIPVLEALHYSHERGVIHRDIKPANILINRQGRPFLTDFGIAKTEESVLQTRTGQMLGTPAYVSPEQAMAEGVDARTDQYSLGIMLYRIMAGRLPFTADTVIQTLVLRLKEDPEPLERYRPDLDPELCAILMRAIQKDREHRWPTVEALREALVAVAQRLGYRWNAPLEHVGQIIVVKHSLKDWVTAPTKDGVGMWEPTADLPGAVPPRRSRWPLVAALILALSGGGAWVWRSRTTVPPTPQDPAPSTPAEPTKVLPGASSSTKVVPSPPPARPKAPPEEVPLRRPVQQPVLLAEGQVAPQPVPGCAGLQVKVTLTVGEDGAVKACRILSPQPPAECGEAARRLALLYRFKPALDAQGRPVEATVASVVFFSEVP